MKGRGEAVVVAVAVETVAPQPQGALRTNSPHELSSRREMQGLFSDEVASDSPGSGREMGRRGQKRAECKERRRRKRTRKARKSAADTDDEVLEEEGQHRSARREPRHENGSPSAGDGHRKHRGRRKGRPASAPGGSPNGWRRGQQNKSVSSGGHHRSIKKRPSSATVDRQLPPFEIPGAGWGPLESGVGILEALPERSKLRPPKGHGLGGGRRKTSATKRTEEAPDKQRGLHSAWDSESGADAGTSSSATRPSSAAKARHLSRRPATAEGTTYRRKVRPSSGASVKSSSSVRSRHKDIGADSDGGGGSDDIEQQQQFRPPSAPRATQRPIHLVGTSPNFGKEYIKQKRPDSGRVYEQRRREGERVQRAHLRSAERRRQETGWKRERALRGHNEYVGREQKMLPTHMEGQDEDEEQGIRKAEKIRPGSAVSREVQMAVALGDQAAETQATRWWRRALPSQQTKVMQEMEAHSPFAAKEARKAQRLKASSDAVEVLVGDHHSELVRFLKRKDHLSLRRTLPETFTKIQSAVGPRKAIKCCLYCMWVLVLLMSVLSISLRARLGDTKAALKTAEAVNQQAMIDAAADAERSAWAASSSSFRMRKTPGIPFAKYARVCRCFTRTPTPFPMHVTRFEAVLKHIYSEVADSSGFSQISTGPIPLLAGMTLYDVSAPWSPPDRAPTGTMPSPPWPPPNDSADGSVAGGSYCDVAASRAVNHECADGLGAAYGSTAQLLWQWSPDRNNGVTDFSMPEAAGMRLESGKVYSFVLQTDYDMRYFFGENAAGRVGAGHFEWQQWQPWDQSGIIMHETSLLRSHDATVLSLKQLDFDLGSNDVVEGANSNGEAVLLPRLARTDAIYSLEAEHGGGVLNPGGSVMVFSVATKTRALGTAAEVAVWRTPSSSSKGDSSTRSRVARWYQALGAMWEVQPYTPYFNSLVVPTSTSSSLTTSSGSDAFGRYLTEEDVLRLRCEFAVRYANVHGGFGAFDEVCAAYLWVYPAQQLKKRDLYQSTVTAKAVASASMPDGIGSDSEAWLSSLGSFTCEQCFGR